MAVIKISILFLCLVIAINGQLIINRQPPSTNPDFPGHCWLKDLQHAVRGGEEWTDRENCVRYSCYANDFSYEIDKCEIRPSTSCPVFPGDKTKDFPGCCPYTTCNQP